MGCHRGLGVLTDNSNGRSFESPAWGPMAITDGDDGAPGYPIQVTARARPTKTSSSSIVEIYFLSTNMQPDNASVQEPRAQMIPR
jgi:hypothetical protein